MKDQLTQIKPYLIGIGIGLALGLVLKHIIPILIITALVIGALYAFDLIKK